MSEAPMNLGAEYQMLAIEAIGRLPEGACRRNQRLRPAATSDPPSVPKANSSATNNGLPLTLRSTSFKKIAWGLEYEYLRTIIIPTPTYHLMIRDASLGFPQPRTQANTKIRSFHSSAILFSVLIPASYRTLVCNTSAFLPPALSTRGFSKSEKKWAFGALIWSHMFECFRLKLKHVLSEPRVLNQSGGYVVLTFLPLHDGLRNNAGTRIRQPSDVAQSELARRIQMPNVTLPVQNVLRTRTFQEETIRSITIHPRLKDSIRKIV